MKQPKISLLRAKVLYDFVLLKPIVIDEVQRSAVKIKKPQQYEDKAEFGEVVAVGDGRLLPDGTLSKLFVKVGDTVLFQKYSTEKVRDPETGIDYLLAKEEDIRLILK